MRHGQILGYETKRFIGLTDVSLSEQGKNQAMLTWHKAFSSIKFNTVYSSSLKRCLNTARLVCPKQEIITDHRLNEINMGDWDGKTFTEIKKTKFEEFEKRGKQMYQFRPAKGESFKDVSDRVLPFFNDLETQQNKLNNNDNKVLVVTHAGVIRVLICNILKMNPDNLFTIKLDYGHLFVLVTSQ